MSSKQNKTFYVTSPIFYPNANLHMGHAYVMTLCDVLARYHKLELGKDNVYFLTGSDENTAKILKSSDIPDNDPSTLLAAAAENFKGLYKRLDIEYSDFIRTTDREKHWPGAIKMWEQLVAAGDIYKSKYIGLYCVGCETFYTEKDLIDGKCPIHLTVPERIEEENYFFRLSKYTSAVKEKIETDELKIVPVSRKNEILALLGRGLDDVSFSRPIKAVPHGIPVPGDPSQVIYVWCDALVNYISALGYGRGDDTLFRKFWPASVHVIGKDILRFHAAIWPAMLMSASLPLPKSLLVHGLITSGGVKMSKSLGNVIDPNDLIEEYGHEAVRYYLVREISPFDDGDMTVDSFKNAYNANLANGIGNLASRIMKMAETNLAAAVDVKEEDFPQEFKDAFERFDVKAAADVVWKEVAALDAHIQETQPFKLVKTDKEKGISIIIALVARLYAVSSMLGPILPETSAKIKEAVKANKLAGPLFARKD
jgi:methionyl-tRNA synthetase